MPKYSIIIPAYNEEATIADIIERCCALDIDKEVIVVDDGSTDATKEIALKYLGDISFMPLQQNRGKGAAMKAGVKASRAQYVIFQDADAEYPPENILKMLEQHSEEKMVVGERTLPHASLNDVSLGSLVANKLFSRIVGFTDVLSGHRIMEKKFFESLFLESEGFEIETEITLKTLESGVPVLIVPITYSPRSWSEGKKIGFSDFLKIMLTIFKFKIFRWDK